MLQELLTRTRPAVLQRWRDLLLESYAPDASRFFREQGDPFANPVGATVSRTLAGLFDELLAGAEPERIAPLLDDLIRLRAVQDFSPSQAVGFVFQLKRAVREQLAGVETPPWPELAEFEGRIDRLALLAFDLYLQCREQIFQIRVKEVKTRSESALTAGPRGKAR